MEKFGILNNQRLIGLHHHSTNLQSFGNKPLIVDKICGWFVCVNLRDLRENKEFSPADHADFRRSQKKKMD